MNFLFVMDPLERVDVTKDTTFVFLAEAERRGHANFVCDTHHLMLDGPRVHAACAPVTVRPVQGDHFTLGERTLREAESFDAVFMRKDPPFDIDFFFATHLLSLIDERRTFVFNRASGLREATEKLFILRFPELIPETFVSADAEQILAFADRVGGEAVVKPLEGCGGMGIFRIRRGDLNTPSILESVTREGRRPVMAQRYLPESRQG
ncbi:MAG: glutathione synthase, partial [Deltaproteobacteria bacterium]